MNGDEYRYIHGRSTAGFIYTHGGEHRFFHTSDTAGLIYTHGGEHRFFHTSDTTEESNRRMVFPPHCIACASEKGLVLFCRLPNADADAGADGNANTLYLVSNPSFTETEMDIPNSPRPHYSPMPRVLVAGWDATRLCLVFHIVCAVQVDNNSSYSFDVYSSNTDTWESTGRGQGNLGLQIRENTGVACGTRAYWLLDSSIPTVAYYDVRGRIIGTIDPAKECSLGYNIASPAELGRWGCELCLVVTWDQLKTVGIFILGEHGSWLRWAYGSSELPPMLSRFQSAKLQVPFWFNNGMVFLENGWRGRRNFRYHAWPKLDCPEPDCMGYVLPHVATDWLPLHFPFAP